MTARGARGLRPALVVLFGLGLLAATAPAEAQTRFMYLSGQTVRPAYEGWWQNEDGTYRLFFGYLNANWEEELVIPVGPSNYFTFTEAHGLDELGTDGYDPAVADQGQPAHFYPRRNPFLFTVDVPADFGDRELVWTLRSQGKTIRAYGLLAFDYVVDPQTLAGEVGGDVANPDAALRANIPPVIEVEGSLHRSVRVGERLRLAVHVEDPDNLPPPRRARSGPRTLDQLYNPPSSIVPVSGMGLRFSWTVYRGDAGQVTFDPIQMKTWVDTRAYANSPWSPPWIIPEPPPGNDWITEATFDEPGEYTLRGVASDGAIFGYKNVIVTVTPLAN